MATCEDIRAQLASVIQERDFGPPHGSSIQQILAWSNQINGRIESLKGQLETQGCYVMQPQYILQIHYQNPDHLVGFNASEIAWGGLGSHSTHWRNFPFGRCEAGVEASPGTT
jgi:hypothetical protein